MTRKAEYLSSLLPFFLEILVSFLADDNADSSALDELCLFVNTKVLSSPSASNNAPFSPKYKCLLSTKYVGLAKAIFLGDLVS